MSIGARATGVEKNSLTPRPPHPYYIKSIIMIGKIEKEMSPGKERPRLSSSAVIGLAAVVGLILAAGSCWNANNPLRADRGDHADGAIRLTHDAAFADVRHADGFGEPSCEACHGLLWNRDECGSNVHTVSLRGVSHGREYCRPLENCIDCHGQDLRGNAYGVPSCYQCHGDRWSRQNCGQNIHTVNLGGVLHAPNACLPYQNCAECHGANLRGGTTGEPSCLSCHTQNKWKDCASRPHNSYLRGIGHAADACRALQECVQCHGSNLRGGLNGEPSCYQCHSDRWNRQDCGTSIHTENKGGVFHAPNYCRPYQNCTSCHGQDLRGGSDGEPSCLSCHNQTKWKNCGTTQHNQREDGVYHASNPCTPFNDCVQCHGSDLRGGPNGEPSCYRCHGAKWNESDCRR